MTGWDGGTGVTGILAGQALIGAVWQYLCPDFAACFNFHMGSHRVTGQDAIAARPFFTATADSADEAKALVAQVATAHGLTADSEWDRTDAVTEYATYGDEAIEFFIVETD